LKSLQGILIFVYECINYTFSFVVSTIEDENAVSSHVNHSDTIAKRLPRLATPEDYEDEDLYVKMTKQFYVHTY